MSHIRIIRLIPYLKTISVDYLFILMKLAQKYAQDDLYDSYIKRLEAELIRIFSDCEKLYKVIPKRELERHGYSHSQLLPSLARRKDELINLVNYAVDLDIQSILPVAYYVVMTHFTTEVSVPSDLYSFTVDITIHRPLFDRK